MQEPLTFCLIASGPSLVPDDCALVKQWQGAQRRVIAVNNSWWLAQWADILYAGDYGYIEHYAKAQGESAPWTQFQGERWTSSKPAADRWKWRYIERRHGRGLSPHPNTINSGDNSGTQAIGLAACLGAKRIILLGFDFKHGPAGRKHWHPDHGRPLQNAQHIAGWLAHLPALAKDLESASISVTNCSRDTAITVFPRRDLREALFGNPDATAATTDPGWVLGCDAGVV